MIAVSSDQAAVQIGLWDVQAASPAVRNVPVFDDGAVMCPLEDAMPLRALIAPLDTFGEQMAAAIDQLQPAPSRGRLALGSIVSAVLDYLVRSHFSQHVQGCSGA